MDDDIKSAEIGRRARPIRARWTRLHAWLERHPRACAMYAWGYRTRAKTLHRRGQHGPHFMGGGRCSWCGKS